MRLRNARSHFTPLGSKMCIDSDSKFYVKQQIRKALHFLEFEKG